MKTRNRTTTRMFVEEAYRGRIRRAAKKAGWIDHTLFDDIQGNFVCLWGCRKGMRKLKAVSEERERALDAGYAAAAVLLGVRPRSRPEFLTRSAPLATVR